MRNAPQAFLNEINMRTEKETLLHFFLFKKFPFDFYLKKIIWQRNKSIRSDDLSGLDNLWPDFMANVFAWQIFSKKMKEVIQENLSGNEGIEWYEVPIHSINETRIYYMPIFTKVYDIIDENRTEFEEDDLICYLINFDVLVDDDMKEGFLKDYTFPKFDWNKIQAYEIIHPYLGICYLPTYLIVSEKMKKAFKKNKLTNIEYTTF